MNRNDSVCSGFSFHTPHDIMVFEIDIFKLYQPQLLRTPSRITLDQNEINITI